jgi:hypothetical protein
MEDKGGTIGEATVNLVGSIIKVKIQQDVKLQQNLVQGRKTS